VIAGGPVATLQSIGAVGLDAGLGSAAAAAGIAVGGLSSLGVVLAIKGLVNGQEGVKLGVICKSLTTLLLAHVEMKLCRRSRISLQRSLQVLTRGCVLPKKLVSP